MPYAVTLFVCCLLFLAPVQGFCEQSQSGPERAGLELGYQLIHFYYDEPVMDEEGYLHGIFAGYVHHFDIGLMLAFEGEFFAGGLDYDGQYQDGTPVTSDTDDYLFQFRGLAGWDFMLGSWTLTPYTGLGWRYWNNDIEVTGGYEREIRYLYLPIGLEAAISPAEHWILRFRGEYDLFLGGQVDANLSDVGPGYEDATLDQDFAEGYGLRASAYAGYAFERVTLGIEPFIRYWDIEKSGTDTAATPTGQATWVEPENTTTIFGAKLSVAF
jgi:hypothetical protein